MLVLHLNNYFHEITTALTPFNRLAQDFKFQEAYTLKQKSGSNKLFSILMIRLASRI